jgi:MerR family transcriptional regulator, light-induced transcriptional regulator
MTDFSNKSAAVPVNDRASSRAQCDCDWEQTIERFIELLVGHDSVGASALVLDAVRDGLPITDIYIKLIQPTMYRIGDLWRCGSLDEAQEYYATALVESILTRIEPRIFQGHTGGAAMIAAAVEGEMHAIGARMVADFFEMDGWDTCYLGANVGSGLIVAESIMRKAKLVALSANGRAMMPAVIGTIAAIQETDALKGTMILVGGGLFNAWPNAVDACGADGYARDAARAVEVARLLIGSRVKEGAG